MARWPADQVADPWPSGRASFTDQLEWLKTGVEFWGGIYSSPIQVVFGRSRTIPVSTGFARSLCLMFSVLDRMFWSSTFRTPLSGYKNMAHSRPRQKMWWSFCGDLEFAPALRCRRASKKPGSLCVPPLTCPSPMRRACQRSSECLSGCRERPCYGCRAATWHERDRKAFQLMKIT